jgi:hypothetical protein
MTIEYVAENKFHPSSSLGDSALRYLVSIIYQHSLAGIAVGKKAGALALLDQTKFFGLQTT